MRASPVAGHTSGGRPSPVAGMYRMANDLRDGSTRRARLLTGRNRDHINERNGRSRSNSMH